MIDLSTGLDVSADRAEMKYGQDTFVGNFRNVRYENAELKDFILGKGDGQNYALLEEHGKITSTDSERDLKFIAEITGAGTELRRMSVEKKELQTKLETATDEQKPAIQRQIAEINARLQSLAGDETNGELNIVMSDGEAMFGIGKYKLEKRFNEGLLQTIEGTNHDAVVYRHSQEGLEGFTIDSWEPSPGELAKISTEYNALDAQGRRLMFKGTEQYLVDAQGNVFGVDGQPSDIKVSELTTPTYTFKFNKNDGTTSSLLSQSTLSQLAALRDENGELKDFQIKIPNLVIAPVSEQAGALRSLKMNSDVVYVSSDKNIGIADGRTLAAKVQQLNVEKDLARAQLEFYGAALGEAGRRASVELAANAETRLTKIKARR